MLAILEGPDLIIVLVVVLVLFGGAQLPKLARGLGEAQREFRKGLHDMTGGPDPKQGPPPQAEAPAAPASPASTIPVAPTPTTSTPTTSTPTASTPAAAAPPAAPTAPATAAGQRRPERVQGPLKAPPIPPTAATQPVVHLAESTSGPAPAKNGQHTAGATASTPLSAAPPAAQPTAPDTDKPEPQTPPV